MCTITVELFIISWPNELKQGRDPAKWEGLYSRLSGSRCSSGAPYLVLVWQLVIISTHAVNVGAHDISR
jgi:hypothetical protein